MTDLPSHLVDAYRRRYPSAWILGFLGYSPNRLLTDQSDRRKLEQVAEFYRDYRELIDQQRSTTAKLIRACTAHIRSFNSAKRKEGLTALDSLAEMLEKQS